MTGVSLNPENTSCGVKTWPARGNQYEKCYQINQASFAEEQYDCHGQDDKCGDQFTIHQESLGVS